jgi:hypothetical protein
MHQAQLKAADDGKVANLDHAKAKKQKKPRSWRSLVGYEPRKPSGWCYPSDFEAEHDTEEERKHPIVKWRRAMLGPDGPPNATTRYVLLTLGTHMNSAGGSCFPSCDLLAKETRLSKRAITLHLEFAVIEGWIERAEQRGPGKGWRLWEYQAVIPFYGGECRSPRKTHRSERHDASW